MTKIQKKIAELLGSCDDLDIEEWSLNDLEELDHEIFLCAQCGWWCEVGEAHDHNGEDICEDCSDSNEG